MLKALAVFSLIGLSANAYAQTEAEFEPGLYEIKATVMLAGGVIEDTTEQECLKPEDSQVSAQTLKDRLPEELSCSYDNITSTEMSMSADFTCQLESFGPFKVSGSAEAEWDKDSAKLSGEGMMTGDGIPGDGAPASMVLTAKRIGQCAP